MKNFISKSVANFAAKVALMLVAFGLVGCAPVDRTSRAETSCLTQEHADKLSDSIKTELIRTNALVRANELKGCEKANYKEVAQCFLNKMPQKDKQEFSEFIAQVDKISLSYKARVYKELYNSKEEECDVVSVNWHFDNNNTIVYKAPDDKYKNKGYHPIASVNLKDTKRFYVESRISLELQSDLIAYNKGLGLVLDGKRQGICKDGEHSEHIGWFNYNKNYDNEYRRTLYSCENGLIKNGLIKIFHSHNKNVSLDFPNEIRHIVDYGALRVVRDYDLKEFWKNEFDTLRSNIEASLADSKNAAANAREQGRKAYDAVNAFTSGRSKTRPSQATINAARAYEKKYIKGDGSSVDEAIYKSNYDIAYNKATSELKQKFSDDYIIALIKTMKPTQEAIIYKDMKLGSTRYTEFYQIYGDYEREVFSGDESYYDIGLIYYDPKNSVSQALCYESGRVLSGSGRSLSGKSCLYLYKEVCKTQECKTKFKHLIDRSYFKNEIYEKLKMEE